MIIGIQVKAVVNFSRLTVSQEEQEVVTKGNENKKVAEEGRIIEVGFI